MNWQAQIAINGFATALFLCLVAQLPAVISLRWWLAATGIGFCSAVLQWALGGASSALLAPLLLLFLSAQLGCILSGLLWYSSRSRFVKFAFGSSLALGALLLFLCGSSPSGMAVASGTLSLLILLLLLAHLSEYRQRYVWTIHVILGVLLWGVLRQLTAIAVGLHWLQPHSVPLLSLVWDFVHSLAIAISLLFLGICDIALRDQRLSARLERLHHLVTGTDKGLCEIDRSGQITFANPAAARLLDLDGENPPDAWIQERLKADHEETSLRTLSEFVLRPTVPVAHATARVHPNEQNDTWVDWSSTPIVRDGQPTTAAVTLSDVTERESEVRFVRFRTELLEMIARNKPVEEISRLLAAAVEERLPGYFCSVLVCESEYFRVYASRALPDDFRSALHTVPCNRILQTTDRSGTTELKNWEDTLRNIARNYPLAGIWAEPIVSAANELLGTVVLHHCVMSPLHAWQTRILREAARVEALAIEHTRAYERLLHQGYHDALTGLPNRLLLADRLQQALARAERKHTQMAFLSIDLDHFKKINDTFGHDVGDLFLRQISARLASRVRSSDTLARTGGDEFTLVLPDLPDTHAATNVAESLIASLKDPFPLNEHTVYASASIGIAFYPGDGSDAETLQRNADRAMYRAKARGRNLVQVYSSADSAQMRDRLEIETQLHSAVDQGTLSLHFQPQVTCQRQLVGFEALLRFQHPTLGMIPPARFIPMAEESGLIVPIGEWVLQEACRQIIEWNEKGLRPVHVAVNVSPLQLGRGNFAETIARALCDTGVRPELLEFEITESVLMDGITEAGRQIADIANLGVRLSVDDFGTGYSCLSYLHQLPLHTLKIDRSFITKMLEPDGAGCIVEAIAMLAHNLGLQTVAEGVENEAQLDLLREAGCDLIQGFLFSRPLTAVDATRLLWNETVEEPGTAWRTAESFLRKPVARTTLRRLRTSIK